MAIINSKRIDIATGEEIVVTERKGELIVNSDKYNNDETYSKKIDETLISLFTAIGDSYN